MTVKRSAGVVTMVFLLTTSFFSTGQAGMNALSDDEMGSVETPNGIVVQTGPTNPDLDDIVTDEQRRRVLEESSRVQHPNVDSETDLDNLQYRNDAPWATFNGYVRSTPESQDVMFNLDMNIQHVKQSGSAQVVEAWDGNRFDPGDLPFNR